MPDNDQQDQPQDITCSGGIKLNLGAGLGGRPDQNGDNDDD